MDRCQAALAVIKSNSTYKNTMIFPINIATPKRLRYNKTNQAYRPTIYPEYTIYVPSATFHTKGAYRHGIYRYH